MISRVETEDGALAYAPSTTPNHVCGPAAQGSALVPQTFGDASQLYTVYQSGKLPDRMALGFAQKAGPLTGLRLGATTAGSIGAVTKTPAAAAAQVFFGGALIAPASNQNGLLVVEKVLGVTFRCVVAGNSTPLTVPALAAGVKDVVVNSATDVGGAAVSTANEIAAAIAAQATVAALIGATPLGTGAATVGAVAQYTLDKGALYLTPRAQSVRAKNQVAGNSTTLDASASSGDVTITDSTDANGLPTGTAAAVLAKINGVAAVAALITPALVGDGTGLLAPAASFVAMPYGSTGVVTASGTPVDSYPITVQILRPGAPGTASFIVSTDLAPTWSAETLVPAGGTYTIPGTGVTLTFANTFDKGDSFGFATVGPTSTAGDLTAALAVYSGLNTDGGEIHFLGGITGAMATMITSWQAAERSAGRDWVCYFETRDYNAGESDATYVAALQADFASVLEPVGCLAGVPGWWNTSIPSQGIARRPFAWTAVSQIWSLPFWVHPVCSQDGGGPIPGLFTPKTPQAPNTHDERLSPGLGGSGGRFMTIQSWAGQQGNWYIADAAGLRSPGTFAAGTSDWSLLPEARLGNRVRRLVQGYAIYLLGRREATRSDGTLTAAERLQLAALVSEFLIAQLGQAVQSLTVEFSATEVVATTKKLPYKVRLKTWKRALEIDAKIGLQK